MSNKSLQIHEISVTETRHVSVDMRSKLDGTELLTGTATVTEITTTALSITNVSISSAELSINGDTVPVAQALQFTVAASEQGRYDVLVRCTTDAGQVIEGVLRLIVS